MTSRDGTGLAIKLFANAAGEYMRNATARLKPGLRSGYVITRFGPVIAHSGIVITRFGNL
ncbi:hypothetical protein [Paraburkholderia sp. ZP32-5]|uniref:hypothetical protein n=1 Tax=Paraburkholderia sp. ZP32-5 TaxID=2883245 RepID=UPI001F4352C8|nr:hypothetical protein [Paraburkholderia sp. ZP32-5]